MKRVVLNEANVDELVDRFAEIGLAQDQALLRDDIRAVNRLYDQLKAIERILKERHGDLRAALARLYDHPNMQVRIKAAKATLAVMPEAARAQLEAVQRTNWQPQSLEAGMSLWNLERGVFKPE